jgi:hypothetical protein
VREDPDAEASPPSDENEREHTPREWEALRRLIIIIETAGDVAALITRGRPAMREAGLAAVATWWEALKATRSVEGEALALCRALDEARTAEEVPELLALRGYGQLAATLDPAGIAEARAAWTNRRPGGSTGRVGKWERLSRVLRRAGVKAAPAAIQRAWQRRTAPGRPRK